MCEQPWTDTSEGDGSRFTFSEQARTPVVMLGGLVRKMGQAVSEATVTGTLSRRKALAET
jgi:hypothetical protein